MTSRIAFTALALFCTLMADAQGKLRINKPDLADLPKDLPYSGQLKDAILFTDSQGDHVVIASETGVYKNKQFKHENKGSDAELFAYHYIVGKENTLQLTWKVYDLVQDCPVDLEARFVKNGLQVTDLNNDGVAEVWITYTTACRGDASPGTMKIIMYEGDRKFAMRGRNKVQITEKEFEGGNFSFDKAFTSGPKEFREFAQKLWNKNILQTS